MKINKNILFALLFIASAAIFYGYKTYNKSHKNLNEEKADHVVTPVAFLAEFEANETVAQTKYLNKVVQLQGKLLEIQTVGSQTIWIISTDNPLSNIQCEMDGRYIQDVKDKVKTGDNVTVQGICSGKLMDIVLSQVVCKL